MASVDKIIGDVRYEITKPLADVGLEFSLATAKIVVPFYAQLELAVASGDMQQMVRAVSGLLVNLTPADLKYINETMGGWTQAHLPDGRVLILRKENFNLHFSDRYDEWITWLVFGVQAVCGSFFAGALGLGALLKKQASPSAEEKTTETVLNSKSPKAVNRTG